MPKLLPEISIIRDSREQQGWLFEQEQKQPGKVRIWGTVDKGLDAGDYAIERYEDLIRIERKAGLRELFGNYTPKENKDRFIFEMQKLKEVKFKYLVIESNLSQDMLSLTVPQMSRFGGGAPGKRVVEWVYDLQREYGIIPIWAGDSGQKIAKMLFKEIARKYL